MTHYQPRNSQTDSSGKNTKKAAKRRKVSNTQGMRQPSIVSMIYQNENRWTLAEVADAATEKRLSRYGPPTSTRLAGFNFIW